MKRDDWKLDNGITAGSNAFIKINGKEEEECYVLKVKGHCQIGEIGNVLIKLNDGQKVWVLGSAVYTKDN